VSHHQEMVMIDLAMEVPAFFSFCVLSRRTISTDTRQNFPKQSRAQRPEMKVSQVPMSELTSSSKHSIKSCRENINAVIGQKLPVRRGDHKLGHLLHGCRFPRLLSNPLSSAVSKYDRSHSTQIEGELALKRMRSRHVSLIEYSLVAVKPWPRSTLQPFPCTFPQATRQGHARPSCPGNQEPNCIRRGHQTHAQGRVCWTFLRPTRFIRLPGRQDGTPLSRLSIFVDIVAIGAIRME
jgi:hypothetical protein